MSGDDPFFSGVRRGGHFKSQADKNESYAERIVRAILADKGMSGPAVTSFIAQDAGAAGWCRWLNERTQFPYAVEACRIFDFNFFDLLFKTKIDGHPLTRLWLEHADNWGADADLAAVFRVAAFGDLTMVSRSPRSEPLIKSSSSGFWLTRAESMAGQSVFIVPFKEFLVHTNDMWEYTFGG